ncbi:hypothetical protein ABPG75_009324 [Micractinium tetrahymenae]
MASPGESTVDWATLLRGKCLKLERINVTMEAARLAYNRCLLPGARWDYRRMSRELAAPALAALLQGCDPVKESTEDKVQMVINMLGAFEHLAPGLCYGGVHKAVLELYSSCSWEWDLHNLSLQCLRLLIECCAITPAGMDPFDRDSLVEVVQALGDHLKDVLEAGMEPKYAQGVDHCLEALYSIARTMGHPAAEAAKRRCWDIHMPRGPSLQHATSCSRVLPAKDFGAADSGERTKGLELWLTSMSNIQRTVISLTQVPGPPTSTMEKQGELLSCEGAFLALKALLQRDATGGAIVRNILSVCGYGSMWVHHTTLLDWKAAGWEPLLRRIRDDRQYRGPYREFFRRMSSLLLEELPVGSTPFMMLELKFDAKPRCIDLSYAKPREPSNLMAHELRVREPVTQLQGPPGVGPLYVYQSQMTAREYARKCTHCGKAEEQLQAEAAAAASGSASSGAPPKLHQCSGCRRVMYCNRECQLAHWPSHKADCKRYRREQA